MKNRFIIVYTIFASLVFVFSLGFFGYNLYSEYSVNYNKSEDRFNQLVTDVKFLSSEHTENTAPYAEAVKKAIGNPEPYAFMELKRDNQTVLLYPAGKTKQETISKMTRSFENTISIQNQTINLYCNYYLIHPNSIFYYARVSFLMILIITLITVIMIVYLSLNENKTIINEESFDDEETNNDEISVDEQTDEEAEAETEEAVTEENVESEEAVAQEEEPVNENQDSADDTAAETESAETSENSADVNSEPQAEAESGVETETEESAATPASADTEAPVKAKAEYEEPVELPINEVQPAGEEDIPSGLYNPETGIGWESYLLPRLNNEIDRATASEIDLALFVIKLADLHLDSEEYKNVCRYLTLQFQFKDLLFEYKEDSIVAIKISMDVDAAITFAEKLYQDIHNIINNKSCFIGISSRSIRMVTGERLMLEADQAVEHAIQDPESPIIAFRVDSDKYRQMMEQR